MVKKMKVFDLRQPGQMPGLTSREAAEKQKVYGRNILSEGKKLHPFQIFICQFKDFLTLVLLAGTVISVLTGEYVEALTIAVIVLLNGIMSFVQEFRTEKTLDALRRMAAPKARVWRDGELTAIEASELVPDDLIQVEAGDRVPADAVITEAAGLSADESMLTGESVACGKLAARPGDEIENVPDRKDILYMGTTVVAGRGTAQVLATGMDTQMGKIAGMISEIPDEQTPLQKKLDQLGKYIAVGCLIICVIVAIAGILRGEDLMNMLMTGISLAVAAVPEGLPAIVTISLALAVRRMVGRNALLRKLSAVEALGCADVICTDKTGTLTTNRMTVTKLFLPFTHWEVGDGAQPFTRDGKPDDPLKTVAGRMTLTVFSLCSDAAEGRDGTFSGDPTETALAFAASKAGLNRRALAGQYTRVDEIPFDSVRKRMSVVVRCSDGKRYLLVKGGCDVLLRRCGMVQLGDKAVPLDSKMRGDITRAAEQLSGSGLRVLAAAMRELSSGEALTEHAENGLTFLGLGGMIDPPRKEVREAVRLCRKAGIRPIMITGDHKLTARAIASQVGIWHEGERVMTGEELDALSEQSARDAIAETTVFARVSPRHKLMIVRALRSQGHITAMTGDGVNDAPAVREADIGVSMGISGTDVTREASDVVLMDDNFATLVAAVEEGRAIYQNIRGFIRYLLACNIGEVLTMFLGILMGMPVVLMPIHILLVNLVTDGLPAIALGLEPAAEGLMDRPPRGADESIFSRGLLGKILFRGCLIGLTTLFVFSHFLTLGDLTLARTAAFFTLVTSQLIHVFECRSEERQLWQLNPLGNKKLLGAAAISATILILAVWCPPLQGILGTAPIPPRELLFIGGALLFAPLITEISDSLFIKKQKDTRVQKNKALVFFRNPAQNESSGVDTSEKIR